MDMVFSDTGDLHGGFYDNNGGLVRRFPCFLCFLPAGPCRPHLLAHMHGCWQG